ncbi:MAG: LysE family translocator [Alphaproteobacteria bacterium]|jgi:threonine/homoserine/homoserine lactone efflux protein
MNYSELPGFIAVAIALLGSPGPATLSLAAIGAAYEFKDCFSYLLGIMAGVSLVIAGVAAGLLTAILAIPYAAGVLSVVSFAYLGFIAYKIASAPPVGDVGTVPSNATGAPGFMSGLILNLTNPKAYASFAALFSSFELVPQTPVYSALVQALICIALLCILNPAWLFAGNALRRHLRDPRISRMINIGFSILLLASVAAAIWVSVL